MIDYEAEAMIEEDLGTRMREEFYERFTDAVGPSSTGAGDPIEADWFLNGDPEEAGDFIYSVVSQAQVGNLARLQVELANWGRTVFVYKNASEAIALHLAREAKEMALKPFGVEEYADCLMLLLQGVSYSPFSMQDVLKAAWVKFGKVQSREYREEELTGIFEHVREGAYESPERRIAACIAACGGVPTAYLENDYVMKMQEACLIATRVLNGKGEASDDECRRLVDALNRVIDAAKEGKKREKSGG